MSAQVFFYPDALEEAEAAARWYRERSSRAAQKLAEEIDEAIGKIVAAPGRWPSDLLGTRKIKLPCFPFSIVYRERGGTIQILGIAHGRRHPHYWKERS